VKSQAGLPTRLTRFAGARVTEKVVSIWENGCDKLKTSGRYATLCAGTT
jgi:hypothetical protein